MKPRKSKRIAIVDVGSNTVRLTIFDTKVGNKSTSLKKLVDIKNIAGLSSYIKDGNFTKAGLDRASRVIKDHIERAENLEVDKIYIFATAVIRNCHNKNVIAKALEKRVGTKIEILDATREATLGIYGALYSNPFDNAYFLDLGGGSCEISLKFNNKISTTSLDVGCVSAYAQFVNCIFPTKDEIKNIELHVLDKMQDMHFEKSNQTCFAIGGSARAIAKISAGLINQQRPKKTISISDIDELLHFFENEKSNFCHLATKCTPERLHTLIPGAIILKTVMQKIGCTSFNIVKTGLREGFLLEKLAGCTRLELATSDVTGRRSNQLS